MAREDYSTTRYRFLKSIKRCVTCARKPPMENAVRCSFCLALVRDAGKAYRDCGKARQAYAIKMRHSSMDRKLT